MIQYLTLVLLRCRFQLVQTCALAVVHLQMGMDGGGRDGGIAPRNSTMGKRIDWQTVIQEITKDLSILVA